MKALEKKYILPFALVTSLFLLWGLANNITYTLLAARSGWLLIVALLLISFFMSLMFSTIYGLFF